MSWMRFSHGLRLDPIAEGSPEALEVLLPDLGAAAASLMPVAARAIDARGTSLAGSVRSEEAIRHGVAYLVELVATAQRGAGFSNDRGAAMRADPP
jgi:hypothetical protein